MEAGSGTRVKGLTFDSWMLHSLRGEKGGKLAGERKSLGETIPASLHFLDVLEEPVHCGEVKEAGVGHGGGRRERLE